MNVEVARPTSDTPLTEQEQERRLADVVLAEQARSAILVAVDGNRAVMARGRRPNHVLHLVLSVLTLGVWAVLVWLPLGVLGGERRFVLTVDEFGRVTRSRPPK